MIKHTQIDNLFYIPMYNRRILVRPLCIDEGKVKVKDIQATNNITYLLEVDWFETNAQYAA